VEVVHLKEFITCKNDKDLLGIGLGQVSSRSAHEDEEKRMPSRDGCEVSISDEKSFNTTSGITRKG
jgi:hypothetical protein